MQRTFGVEAGVEQLDWQSVAGLSGSSGSSLGNSRVSASRGRTRRSWRSGGGRRGSAQTLGDQRRHCTHELARRRVRWHAQLHRQSLDRRTHLWIVDCTQTQRIDLVITCRRRALYVIQTEYNRKLSLHTIDFLERIGGCGRNLLLLSRCLF